MMTFVEEGTAFAAEFGYGDDAFFASLERMLASVLEQFRTSPAAVGDVIEPRLLDLRELARDIAWDYGEAVADAVASATREEDSSDERSEMANTWIVDITHFLDERGAIVD
jgi:hypothetical protein